MKRENARHTDDCPECRHRGDHLEPISPEEALAMYLREKQIEYRPATLKSHDSRLSKLRNWCEEQGITNLNELGARELHQYRLWRREDGDLNKVSEKTQQDTVRIFIRFCESIDAVHSGLAEKVISPSLAKGENTREEMLDAERAEEILDYLRKYQYASREHVVLEILNSTGIRTGGLRSLDLQDYYSDTSDPHFRVRHRAGETPIKNGAAGERHVFLYDSVSSILEDYVSKKRDDVEDEFGRSPLLATRFGRAAGSTIRKYSYKWTRPCAISEECPHGKEIENCPAASQANEASKCPSSRAPHACRRGYITSELEEGVPVHILSDRCNVTESVLNEHYDGRSQQKRMEQRKELMEAKHEGPGR